LAAEYASLFLGAGRHLVFPYESVYTSAERLMMQEARDAVLLEYRREGLDRSKEFKEPEDHIAIELEFMFYLCQKTIESMGKGDKEASLTFLKKQKDFLQRHLMVWVPDFCEDLEQATESDFYKGIAKVTKDYLSLEQETIGELMNEIQGWPGIDFGG
ncbi:MAG: molecular chaperone TorD family protein, partial [Chloroflexi bacterium]|nr:molecular chaperone TorD family protein [Chloroflexota bacterium]